ncbi:thioredoxin domain-containing protein [Nannocystaceae bacterium ST9]
MRTLVLGLGLLLGAACAPPDDSTKTPSPGSNEHAEFAWSSWERAAFDHAREHDKIILINVVAQWCHWCHVMDETTYEDPEVAALLAEHFVTIRVDSDARPDIAERYRRWGWPATAFLTPAAEGVLELRGYRDPEAFAAILRELIDERDAGTLARHDRASADETSPAATDLAGLQATWEPVLDGFYDAEAGGWGEQQKYPWPGPIEFSLLRARTRGEAIWRERGLFTLDAHRQLIDPVWGGMFQYSVRRVWTMPHYEKIAMIQAGAIENFSHAFMVTRDPKWLAAAADITRYLLEHMQDDAGGFWTSQDADVRPPAGSRAPTVLGIDYYALDDAGRREVGIPRTDTHVYADLNGAIIHSLTELHRVTRDPELLNAAISAADRLIRTHRDPSGGFRHGEASEGPLHLADQVALGRAFLGLHRVTQDRRWLAMAIELAEFMRRELAAESGGFWAHQADPEAVGVFAQRRMPPEENGLAAQFLLELHGIVDGDGSVATPWRELAERAVLAVGTPAILEPEGKVISRWLFAIELLRGEAVDVSVVGERGDPQADALWQAALELWEPRASFERSVPGERYPTSGVYLCTSQTCSSPIRTVEGFAAAAESFLTGSSATEGR